MESIIVAMRRTMSLDHPLHEILKYHFRGTVLTNRLALPALLEPGSNTHLLFAIGHVGSIEVLNKAYKEFYWQETDFPHFLEVGEHSYLISNPRSKTQNDVSLRIWVETLNHK